MSITRTIANTYQDAVLTMEPDEYGGIQVGDLQEISEEVKPLRKYLSGLRKTYLNSLITIVASSIVGIPAFSSLVCFASTGKSFMHPYLGIFFTLFAIGMLILGILSSLTTKSYFEKALLQLTKE